MSDFLHDHQVPDNVELDSVIARPQPIVASQFTAQRLRPTHVGPLLKPHEPIEHAGVNRVAELLQLVRCCRGQHDCCDAANSTGY
jgi:hypothetical protein